MRVMCAEHIVAMQVVLPAAPAVHAGLLERYMASAGTADLACVPDDGYFLQARCRNHPYTATPAQQRTGPLIGCYKRGVMEYETGSCTCMRVRNGFRAGSMPD